MTPPAMGEAGWAGGRFSQAYVPRASVNGGLKQNLAPAQAGRYKDRNKFRNAADQP